jgi:hypothetical protein
MTSDKLLRLRQWAEPLTSGNLYANIIDEINSLIAEPDPPEQSGSAGRARRDADLVLAKAMKYREEREAARKELAELRKRFNEHAACHKKIVQAEWPPMSTGLRSGEPEGRDAWWLAWFCGMVRDYAWFVPPGDVQVAGEIATAIAKQMVCVDKDGNVIEVIIPPQPESLPKLDHHARADLPHEDEPAHEDELRRHGCRGSSLFPMLQKMDEAEHFAGDWGDAIEAVVRELVAELRYQEKP